MEYMDEVKLWANKLVMLVVLVVLAVPMTIYILVHRVVQWWVVDLFDRENHEPLTERMAMWVTFVIMTVLTLAIARLVFAHI